MANRRINPLLRFADKAYKKINIHNLKYECVRCGQCCKTTTCLVAEILEIEKISPCPALEYDDNQKKYSCGIIVNPHNYIKDEILDGEKKDWLAQYLKRLLFVGKCSNFHRLNKINVR